VILPGVTWRRMVRFQLARLVLIVVALRPVPWACPHTLSKSVGLGSAQVGNVRDLGRMSRVMYAGRCWT